MESSRLRFQVTKAKGHCKVFEVFGFKADLIMILYIQKKLLFSMSDCSYLQVSDILNDLRDEYGVEVEEKMNFLLRVHRVKLLPNIEILEYQLDR